MDIECSKCGVSKAREAFGKDKLRPTGLFPYCKRCRLRDPDKHDEIKARKAEGLHHCSQCKQWKTAADFYSNTSTTSGIHGQCRICSKQAVQASYYADVESSRAANRESSKLRVEAIQKKNRKQYTKNAERNKQRSKDWHKENYAKVREQRIQYLRDRAKTDHAKIVALRNTHKRRANVRGIYSCDEWNALLDATGRVCLRCGITEEQSIYAYRKAGNLRGKLTVDHIIPVSKGGCNVISSLQCLCMPCQQWKRDKPIDFRPHAVRVQFRKDWEPAV